MGQQTPLFDSHRNMGAKMVDFGGWDMPVHYGSLMDEHHAVRRDAGMFDVSHMTVVDLHGENTRDFLRHLLANDIAKLTLTGKALYTCLLNENGGIIDDLIVYYLQDDFYRLIVNAATRDNDLAWIEKQATPYDIETRVRDDLAMIAVQGPQARDKAAALLPEAHREEALALKAFTGVQLGDFFIARTGYTGEDGWEMLLPADKAAGFWQTLADAGVAPCGLGARDTLRLEAALNLYGQDMDETTTPLESALGWTIAWEPEDRDFIGRSALAQQKADGIPRKLVGLLLEDKGVLRPHQKVITQEGEGEVTSGTFSPTLGRTIGLARIPKAATDTVQVEIRGKKLTARTVKPPFVRKGKALV